MKHNCNVEKLIEQRMWRESWVVNGGLKGKWNGREMLVAKTEG